jgi:hypothetical protein
MRGVFVWTITVSIFTPASVDSIANRPSCAEKTASADGTEIRSPAQRQQPKGRRGP